LCVLISLLVLLAMSYPIFLGKCYLADDLGDYHLPLRAFYASCLRDGAQFTWLPNLYCGFYLQGEGQLGMYHPLHYLLYKVFPLSCAFGLELILSYPFMLIGMFLFLRRLDAGRGAAMFGAMVFTFSGFNVLHHIHINAIAVISHIPWLMFAIDVLLRAPSSRRAAAAGVWIALLTASQVLLGHPQSVWFSVIAELVCVVMIFPSVVSWRRLFLLAQVKILGLVIGAAQLIPTIDKVLNSARQAPTESFKFVGSHPVVNLLQLVLPYLFTARHFPQNIEGVGYHVNVYEFGLYCGAATIMLALWLAINAARLGERKRVVVVAAFVFVFAFILSFGKFGIVYRIQTYLPLIGSFRYPSRYMVIATLMLSLLAGLAMDEMLRGALPQEKQGFTRRAILLVPVLIALAGAAGGMVFRRYSSDASIARYFSSQLWILGSLLITAMATMLVFVALKQNRLALVCLVLFAGADQAYYGVSAMRLHPPQTVDSYVETRSVLPKLDDGLRFADIKRSDDAWIMNGRKLVMGYVALAPSRQLDFFNSMTALRLAGAKWRQATDEPPSYATDSPRRVITWEKVPDPMPRARLVTNAVCTTRPAELLESIDIKTTALVAEDVALGAAEPGSVAILRDLPGRIELSVACGSTQLLVLSESYHEGWKAFVDGAACNVLPVYGDFIGCVVQTGRHNVRLEFDPINNSAGIRVSLLGLFLLLSWFLYAQKTSGSSINRL